MTDTTAVDAAKDAESAAEAAASAEQSTNDSAEPKRTDAEWAEHWKKHCRDWEDRAKKNLAEKDAVEARNAALEKALEDGKDTDTALAESRAQAARYRAALVAGIDIDTADKVLTGSDEETIAAQAEAFNEAVKAAAEKSAESAPRSGVREAPNAGMQGAEKPDYKAQAEELRRKFK